MEQFKNIQIDSLTFELNTSWLPAGKPHGEFDAMTDVLVPNLDDDVINRLRRQAETRKITLDELLREILMVAAGPSRQQVLTEMDRIRRMTPKRLTDESTNLTRQDRDRQ